MKINARGRGRIAASLVASMALIGGAAAVTTQPAVSAEPAGDCTPAAPVSGIAKGDLVTGLTVSSGTTPEEFDGEILGVLEDGIAPGLDMIMARLSSAEIDRVGGIWQGMSGSPVYDADGNLIGAVSYGLAWGPSPVAGITPFEEMDNYLPVAPAAKVDVSARTARQIAAGSDVSAARAEEGFTQLRIPNRVAGLSAARIEKLRTSTKFKENDYLVKKLAGIGGNAAPGAAGPETIVAGGNLAAAASFGDITMGGVGTATSVCDGGVVAFGHPFNFLGTTSLTLHPADALYVQEDPVSAPFKVANLGAAAGTIDGDHLSGISGSFGTLPPLTEITSTVSYLDRSRTGSSSVSVPEANASVTFYQQLANHDRVLDGIIAGSEHLSWTVTGDDNGTPFTLSSADVYTSEYDIAYESPWEVADLVYVISAFEGVTVDDVTINGAVDDDTTSWRVGALEQKQDGAWVKINRRHPAQAAPGGVLKIRVVLDGSTGDSLTVPLQFDVPKKASRQGYLWVEGGAWQYTDIYGASNIADVQKALEKAVSNDQVVGWLEVSSRNDYTRKKAESEPTGQVVYGSKRAEVRFK